MKPEEMEIFSDHMNNIVEDGSHLEGDNELKSDDKSCENTKKENGW